MSGLRASGVPQGATYRASAELSSVLIPGADPVCHAQIPGPTRLADPNRVRGARSYTATLYLLNQTVIYPSLIIYQHIIYKKSKIKPPP